MQIDQIQIRVTGLSGRAEQKKDRGKFICLDIREERKRGRKQVSRLGLTKST